MMVGSRINKEISMKNRNLLSAVFLFSFLLVACSDKADETKSGEEGIQISFDNASDYVPAELKNWPHALFVFNGGECIDVQQTPNQSSLNIAALGDKMLAMAYENTDNLLLGAMSSGVPLSSYYLTVKDINQDIPQIWMGQPKESRNETVFSMKPVTSLLKVNLLNVPEDFKSLSFVLPGIANQIKLYTGEIASSVNVANDKKIEIIGKDSGKEFIVFPMLNDGQWTLTCTFELTDGTQIEKSLTISNGIKNAQSLEVNADFANYESRGSCELNYRSATYGMDNWVNYSATVLLKEQQEENRYYNVYVQQKDGSWKKVDVHYALCSDSPNHHTQIWNDWDNSKHLRDTMSFTNFVNDFSGLVKVRIQKKKSFNTVVVRPTTYGITPSNVGDNTIEFTLPSWEQRKVSVEFDNDRYHNLMLLPNKPDPNKPDVANIPANVKYYGPGKHYVDRIILRDNETLYIDEGAIVYGKVNAVGDNVTITGRGILSGEKLVHSGNVYAQGYLLIESNPNFSAIVNKFTVSGITVVDSPNWTLSVYNTDHVKIDNINIICWILNGDGIDLCSVHDATINDCFIRTYDDCITLKVNSASRTAVKDVRITKCLIWADYARGIVIGPESGFSGVGITDCSVEDCVILEHPKVTNTNTDGAGLSISQYPSGGKTAGNIERITMKNLVIDNLQSAGRPIAIFQEANQESSSLIKDVTFQNIRILDEYGRQMSHVYSNGNKIQGLIFDNVTYNGTRIDNAGKLSVNGTNIDIIYK